MAEATELKFSVPIDDLNEKLCNSMSTQSCIPSGSLKAGKSPVPGGR